METEDWDGETFICSDDENSRNELAQDVLLKLESKEYLHSEDGQNLIKDLHYFCDQSICECIEGTEPCLPLESIKISEESLKSEKDECDICTCKDKEECPHKMKKKNPQLFTREKCTCENEKCTCINKDKCPHKIKESREHKDIIRVTNVDYLKICVEVEQTTHIVEKDKCDKKSFANKNENLNEETYNIKVVVDEGHIREIVQEGEDTDSGENENVFGIIEQTELINYSEMPTEDGQIRKSDKIKSTLISNEKTITLAESFKTSNQEPTSETNDFIRIENKTQIKIQDNDPKSSTSLQESECEDRFTLKSKESSSKVDSEILDDFEIISEKENFNETDHLLTIDDKVSGIQIEEKPFVQEFLKSPQPKKKCTGVCSSFITISETDSEISLDTIEKFIFDSLTTEVLYALDEAESENKPEMKQLSIKDIIPKSDSSRNIGDLYIYEDAESDYAPREIEDKIENAQYYEIKHFAEILLNEIFKNAQDAFEHEKELLNQRLLLILSEKQEAKKELLSFDEEEEIMMKEKLKLLTNSSFNIIRGYKFIENLIEQWTRIEDWRHCTKLIDKYSDHSTNFFIYEVIWSLPTAINPVPIATASLFFEFRVSHIKPKSYPVEVQYNFEFSRFTHYPGKTRFKEKWLYDILRAKEKMYDALRY